ncbi:MAG: sigma-70 family RNA polymerase sigma factor [Solirubrobacterales bacterium]|nr:sigma-70 family RNA polymerase sigma factor [Solirubrobacterales bacterium]
MSSPPVTVNADEVIGAEYDAFKDEVTRTAAGKLGASKIRFAELDMDGFYNQAWFGLYTKLQDGQQIENRKGLLIQMTYRRAIDEYRTLHPDRQADPVVLETLGVDNPIEETIDQQQEFKHFVEGMRSELNQRELQAATLCYVYGMSRPEAAEQVGVRPKRMEKIMDEVSRKMRPVLASIKEGNWCEDRAVLINQFALGALDPEGSDYREAIDHLEDCPGCRRHVMGTRGLTAVTIPSALMLFALTGAAVGAGAAGAAAAGSSTAGGSSAGAAAAAGTGAGIGGAAQIAAVVAAIAAVAAGGVVAANQLSGADDAAAPRPASQNANTAATAEADAAKAEAAKEAAAERAATRRSAARRKAAAEAEAKAEAQQPAPQQTQPQAAQPVDPQPAQPQATPSNPSEDGGAEFDLQ